MTNETAAKLRLLRIPRKHKDTLWQKHAAADICRFFRCIRETERRKKREGLTRATASLNTSTWPITQ